MPPQMPAAIAFHAAMPQRRCLYADTLMPLPFLSLCHIDYAISIE